MAYFSSTGEEQTYIQRTPLCSVEIPQYQHDIPQGILGLTLSEALQRKITESQLFLCCCPLVNLRGEMESVTRSFVGLRHFKFSYHANRVCRTEHGHTSCCFIHRSPVSLTQSPQTNSVQQVAVLAKCSASTSRFRI